MSSFRTILLAAVLPPFLLILYIWWKDRQQPEPFSQLVKGFLFGILSAGIAILLESGISIFHIAPDEPANFFQATWKAFMGAAIPEEVAERIFEPFSRGDAARPTDGGSGLGLSIAESIVRMHGWELSLQTDISGYTKGFVIRIPW